MCPISPSRCCWLIFYPFDFEVAHLLKNRNHYRKPEGEKAMQSEIEVHSGNRYLTVAQLAERLQVSASTIYGWVDRDVVPFLMAGDLLRFDPAAIDNWMATRAASKREKKRSSFVHMIK